MAYAVESRTNTPGAALRDALSEAERLIVGVNNGNVEALLRQLDIIDSLLDNIGATDADLRPEEGRWQGLQNRLASDPGTIVKAANRAGGMAKLRAQNPPATAFWWHLDAEVGRRRRKSVTRFVFVAGATVITLWLIFWAINRFFPPDPDTLLVLEATTQVESLVMAGDWEAALDIIEEARETLPDDPELLIWAAVLSEMLENMEQAEDYLEHAQDLFDTRLALFWVTVGNKRIAVGNVDMAEEAVLKALELDQEMPMAVFLKANVAEARGERLTAIDLYNQTFDLAEQSDPQLAVISKVRMGQLMQQIDPFADIATPAPEATPGL